MEAPLVTINTTMGSITLELYQTHAPNTVDNFLRLVKRGYYNNTPVHPLYPMPPLYASY